MRRRAVPQNEEWGSGGGPTVMKGIIYEQPKHIASPTGTKPLG